MGKQIQAVTQVQAESPEGGRLCVVNLFTKARTAAGRPPSGRDTRSV